MKAIMVLLGITLSFNFLAKSQMVDSINAQGWKNILLGSPLDSVSQFVIPFDQSKLKESMFATPEKDAWYVYIDTSSSCSEGSGIIFNHILIAVSENNIIKKITIYVNNRNNQLDSILNQKFGNNLIDGESSLNESRHLIWHPSKEILLYYFTTKTAYYFPVGSNAELTFSFVKDSDEYGKYIVRPGFNLK